MDPRPSPSPAATATRGGMTLEIRPDALACRIRADSFRAARLPRNCEVGARLGVWNFERVVVAALVARVGPDASLAGEFWIDGTDQLSIQALRCLTKVGQIRAVLHWPEDEREFHVANCLQADAVALLRRLEKWTKWSHADYESALKQLQTLYPTPLQLWRDCPRN